MSLSRRTFLQTTLAAATSLCLPRSLRAEGRLRFWFIHTETGAFWPVVDPVVWCLENARNPILERARERLVMLDASDPQRIIRVVVRRCALNLIELHPGRVVVHYWGEQGQGDLQPFFKHHGLARNDVCVTLIDRKRETSTVQTGADFLYGEQLSEEFPLDAYLKKWRRRSIEEQDDWTAAPHTWSGFVWDGIEPNCIPWAALKSAWRRTTPMLCPNCDEPTVLTNFGLPQYGYFNREALFLHACGQCQTHFQDYSIDRFEVMTWMEANLDTNVLPPDFILWMGKPVKW